jgi:hypothetical protein
VILLLKMLMRHIVGPGWNYMFWCSQNNGVIVPNDKNILCYDSADQLVLVTTE